MNVLLAVAGFAGKALRLLASVLLTVPYVLGWLAGGVVVSAVAVATAARLGWTDVVRRPRRSGHGAA